jgi:hypothetical protein
MVYEYEKVFMTALHTKLKSKIRAGIDIRIYDDIIYVNIIRDGNVDYTYEIRNFSDKFLHDYTTDHAVCEVVSAYKKYLVVTHFY